MKRVMLMTKENMRLAQAQYPQGNDLDQLVVCKIFDPCSQWTWYVMNQDPDDPSYLWGIVRGFDVEVGSFSLDELKESRNKVGLYLERDYYFKPRPAREVLAALEKGEHV